MNRAAISRSFAQRTFLRAAEDQTWASQEYLELGTSPTPLFAFRLVRQTTAGCARVSSRTYSARREQAPQGCAF